MKNLTKVLLLIAVGVIFLAGCSLKTQVGIVVDKNEDVKMEIVSAMDNEMIDYYLGMQDSMTTSEDEEATEPAEEAEQKVYTDEERWAYMENSQDSEQYKGYEKTRYEEGEYKGFKYTRSLGKLDEVSAETDTAVDFENIQEENKIFTKKGDVYTLHIDTKGSGDNSIDQAKSYKDQGVDIIIGLYVTLPQEAISNNATEVSEDKLTYTWDLLTADSVDLSFKAPSAAGSSNNILPIIIGAVVVIAVIAGVAVVASKKKEG